MMERADSATEVWCGGGSVRRADAVALGRRVQTRAQAEHDAFSFAAPLGGAGSTAPASRSLYFTA